MTDLFEFGNKLRFELNENKIENDDSEEKSDQDNDDGGSLGIRRVNSKEAVGKATKDFDWQVDFNTLRKAICKDVVTIDLAKTKKLFKLFKDYINDQEKFEEKYK